METAVQTLHPVHSSSQQSLNAKGLVLHEFSLAPLKSMDELICSPSPALHSVERKELLAAIVAFIGDYLSFIGTSMEDVVIAEVASMMIDNHPHLPVDAIKTFFYECKRGTYGFHYNKMDGTKLLMWFDKFVQDYYKQLDDMQYEKHLREKEGLTEPLVISDEEGHPINAMELLASFHGKTVEEMERERKIADIRMDVCKKNMHLYDTMPVEEADKIIENAIIEEMKAQKLLTF